MANQRSKNQTLVAFPLDRAFLDAVDMARGSNSRSAFIRDALAAYLKAGNVVLPTTVTKAPDRAGKGGRPARSDAYALAPETARLNEEPTKEYKVKVSKRKVNES